LIHLSRRHLYYTTLLERSQDEKAGRSLYNIISGGTVKVVLETVEKNDVVIRGREVD